ncbi:MAG: hypothetical protein WC748_02005 [Legionellales bacterium]|jgi:hypothetical protein
MKLTDIIFCDDIRIELNNKFSLMGVYNDKIIFHAQNSTIKFPLPLKLALFLRFKLDVEDEHPENFEFIYFMNREEILKINGDIKSNDDTVLLALAHQTLPLKKGELNFSIKLLKNNKTLFQQEAKGLEILQSI